MSTTTASRRRTKWQPTPPPPPSPKVLQFPRRRRTRRKVLPKPTTTRHHQNNNPLLLMHKKCISYKGKLENLFDQENHESPMASGQLNVSRRRERVEEGEEEYNGGFEEEKWRFQAEILRAECNFLRMERQFALKKLERNRVQMERTLRSAVHTLISGREKIFEGKNVNLDEEIDDLADKLEELQNTTRNKDHQVKKCSNFDKKASILQHRLEKLGGLSNTSSTKELQEQECTESSLSISINSDIDKTSNISNHKTKTVSHDVDMLRQKMEGFSKGMLDRVEEDCGSMISSSVASSASTSKRIECPEISCFSTRQTLQEENKCSGRCKGVIRKIVEQVRAETEQWSQMQQMLGKVRGEMEELQASRDFWENRAHNSDYEIQTLKHAVEEWKERAIDSEIKANQLQLELSVFKGDVQKDLNPIQDLPPFHLQKQLENEKQASSCRLFENSIQEINIKEEEKEIETPSKDLHPPISLAKQLAKEKRMFIHHHSKENLEKNSKHFIGFASPKRSPLRDIGNISSPLLLSRQTSRRSCHFDSPESFTTIRESIRKREPKASLLHW